MAANRRVMLVDDNALTRKLVRFALEEKGLGVLEASDGETAVRLMAERPALVLQDLNLPDVDGFELVVRLRASTGGSGVPILAFSGLLSAVDEARLAGAGFDGVIAKPVEPSRLVQAVFSHLPDPGPAEQFGKGRKLLLADDDPVQLKLTSFRLARLGFAIDTAGDGAAALELARRNRPDVIVSDVMMPRLDGFQFCAAVREDPVLAAVPVVLLTASYIETADRELARRSGASDFVIRTHDLADAVHAVRRAMTSVVPDVPQRTADISALESERNRRVMQQLEKQVAINAGIARRAGTLTAEIAVLRSISEALTRREDIGAALDEVLASCFDAGGISLGVLWLVEDGALRARTVGVAGRLSAILSADAIVRGAIARGTTAVVPSPEADPGFRTLVSGAGFRSAILAPMIHGKERLGALLMLADNEDLAEDDRVAFAESVANQIAQAVALAHAFTQTRRQAATLELILEGIADGVAVTDAAGGFTLMNHAAKAMLAADGSGPEGPLERALHDGRAESAEIQVPGNGGKPPAFFQVRSRPLEEAGVRRGTVAVFRDVTREKATQAQLLVSDRMASIGTLAAGVAHEINNPLAAVLANVELALTAAGQLPGSADLVAELEDAREAADRVRSIVRDLKIFSRSQDEERSTPVDVRRVMDSSLRMAWNEIRHRARLEKVYEPVAAVDANESRLGQVFLNLLVNAAQAIPEGRAEENEIRVAIRPIDGRVAVEVSDTGAGIPPDVLPRVFAPFFTTKPAGVGTGLGLSICERIVQSMGGEIAAESVVGKGTTFRVLLRATLSAPVVAAPRTAVTAAKRRGRVLVVDDEALVGAVITRALRAQHDVAAVTRGEAALQKIDAGERFDLILCDLMMPTMTGMDLHAELFRRAPEQAARMVFLTGGAFTEAAREFLDRVPNARLDKPFDAEELKNFANDRIR